jgi:2-(1,2-epoxy-1,2-dihydrophenyl)acetyl-CoA isomerase
MPDKIVPINETLNIQTKEGVCWITMNRPKSLNALTSDLAAALTDATSTIKNSKEIRAVVISGEGDHFMAGGDIKNFKTILSEETTKEGLSQKFEDLLHSFHKIIINMHTMPQPILASVSGAVAGAGVSLMAACDLAIASEEAFFTLAYCNLGVSPDGGSTYSLPRTVGLKRAFEIALLGDRFDAELAEKWGMINKVVSRTSLRKETEAMANRLASGPSIANAKAKKLLYSSCHSTLEEQLHKEVKAFSSCTISEDFKEGVDAFINKRTPVFTSKN